METLQLSVLGSPTAAGPDDVAERAANLAQELRLIGVDVRPATSQQPIDGVRSDPLTIGALILAFSASHGVFTELIGLLRDWVGRNGSHALTLKKGDREITITGTPSAQEQTLISEFQRDCLTQ